MREIQRSRCGWSTLTGRAPGKTFLKADDLNCISRRLCGGSWDPRLRSKDARTRRGQPSCPTQGHPMALRTPRGESSAHAAIVCCRGPVKAGSSWYSGSNFRIHPDLHVWGKVRGLIDRFPSHWECDFAISGLCHWRGTVPQTAATFEGNALPGCCFHHEALAAHPTIW